MTFTLVVADTGPVIHLDELGCLDILSDFHEILIPPAVRDEIARHRPDVLQRRDIPFVIREVAQHHPKIRPLHTLFTLHRGESEALTLCADVPDSLLLTDDTAARLAAQNLGIQARGTLGLLLRAIRRQTRTRNEILRLLASIPTRSTLHIRPSLLDRIMEEVRQLPND
jgi:predicted nucleic acid-binding protein